MIQLNENFGAIASFSGEILISREFYDEATPNQAAIAVVGIRDKEFDIWHPFLSHFKIRYRKLADTIYIEVKEVE